MQVQDALTELVAKLSGWVTGFILLLPNLVVAVIVVIGFGIASRIARRVVLAAVSQVSSHPSINKLVASFASVGLLSAGVFVALGIVGLDKTVMSLLAAVGIIGLALGFAFQDIASNFMAARSEAIVRIKKAYDQNGITIPFPIRTLDFGEVGGERLDEVLPRALRAGRSD